MRRLSVIVGWMLAAGACGGSTAPTPVPPPTPDPPKISCPAPQTIQLTTGTSTPVSWTTPTVANGTAPVTTTCTPQSGSPFAVGATSVTCTATDAAQPPRTDSCSFTVTVVAPPRLALLRYVAFGDSITAGEDGVDGGPDTSGLCLPKVTTTTSLQPRVILPDAQTYPGQLQASLSARYQTQSPTVLKRGCPGEEAAGPTTRQRFDALVSTGQYDVVLIMEGSNDLDSVAGSDSATQNGAIGKAAAALRSLVTDAKSVGVRPLLATIPPMNPAGRRGGGASLVSPLNDRIFQIGNAESLTIVDVYGGFNGNLSLLGDDGLHPTAAGYTVIADTFFAAIKSSLEIKAALTPSAVLRRRR